MMAEPSPYNPLYSDDEGSDAREEEAFDISDTENHVTFPLPDPDERVAPVDVGGQSTTLKKRQLNVHTTYQAVRQTLVDLEQRGIDLPIFLEAVSWCNPLYISDPVVKHGRTTLLHSVELPRILGNWHTPPRSSIGMKRPAGAKAATEAFAIETILEIITRELKVLGPLLRLPAGCSCRGGDEEEACRYCRIDEDKRPCALEIVGWCLAHEDGD
ncbi:hypothetical protein NMY22_g13932 [Coprinellus aureogranulatus]|nr:hypothetical protein NMY22_g13932 [Coprinellus aureogranulatus]